MFFKGKLDDFKKWQGDDELSFLNMEGDKEG